MNYIDGMGTLEYFRYMHDVAAAIVVHPLSDCDFNRAKSMACYLEASHAGAAFVGPDFEEFQRPGITAYKPDDGTSFFDAVNNLIEHPNKIIENAAVGRKTITGPLELGVINEIRMKVFRALAS